jgi:hypothetical protein
VFLEPAEALQLIEEALHQPTPDQRLRAGDDVIRVANRMSALDDAVRKAFDRFRAQYLRDCVELSADDKGLAFLGLGGLSANHQKDLLEPALILFVRNKKWSEAIRWCDSVRSSFGAAAVEGLPERPGLAALGRSKRFQKLLSPDYDRRAFDRSLREAQQMWKRGRYDNYKDALLDPRSLVDDAMKLGGPQAEAAQAHLATVEKKVKQVMRDDPEIREYLRGLLDA